MLSDGAILVPYSLGRGAQPVHHASRQSQRAGRHTGGPDQPIFLVQKPGLIGAAPTNIGSGRLDPRQQRFAIVETGIVQRCQKLGQPHPFGVTLQRVLIGIGPGQIGRGPVKLLFGSAAPFVGGNHIGHRALGQVGARREPC